MSEQKIMDLVRQYRYAPRSELLEIADEIIKQIEILKLAQNEIDLIRNTTGHLSVEVFLNDYATIKKDLRQCDEENEKLLASLEFKEQSVPDGYMLVMVPQEFENEPDWDDIKRQAEEASGLAVEQHTYSMIIREVRRWMSSIEIKPKSLITPETKNKKSDRTCSTCKHSDSWGLPDCVMPGSCGPDRLHYEPLNKQ